MKKQQILLTIGACLLIVFSFAVLFAYLIPELKTKFSFDRLEQAIPTDSQFQVRLRDRKLELNGKPITSQNAPVEVPAQRNIGKTVLVSPDLKTICFDIDYPNSNLVETYCVNSNTNEIIWTVEQWKSISPGDAPESKLDNEKYTYISDLRTGNKTEYLLHPSIAAFGTDSFRAGFNEAFAQAAKQISEYDFPAKYSEVRDLNRKAFEEQDSEWVDQYYFVTFYSSFGEITATIAFNYGNNLSAEFNFHQRNSKWQEIPGTSNIQAL